MPPKSAPTSAVLLATGLLLSACASSADSFAPPLTTGTPAAPSQAGAYTLTEDELDLDCKRLTGRMQVRILQIRDFASRPQTSATSHTLQQAAISIFGGTTEGTAPAERYARDKAILQAYNRRLAEKGCKTFDLDAELQPKPYDETPMPVQKD